MKFHLVHRAMWLGLASCGATVAETAQLRSDLPRAAARFGESNRNQI